VREGIIPYHSRFIPAFSLRRNNLVSAVLESHIADRAMRADGPDRIPVETNTESGGIAHAQSGAFRQVNAADITGLKHLRENSRTVRFGKRNPGHLGGLQIHVRGCGSRGRCRLRRRGRLGRGACHRNL
jgi:hypothetical protein